MNTNERELQQKQPGTKNRGANDSVEQQFDVGL